MKITLVLDREHAEWLKTSLLERHPTHPVGLKLAQELQTDRQTFTAVFRDELLWPEASLLNWHIMDKNFRF